MTALITSIICLIVLGAATGSFFVGKYISSIQQRNELLETNHVDMLKHIEEQDEVIRELQSENEMMRKEQSDARPTTPFQAWNPGDPLNSSSRL